MEGGDEKEREYKRKKRKREERIEEKREKPIEIPEKLVIGFLSNIKK